jgi:hypothetical protein
MSKKNFRGIGGLNNMLGLSEEETPKKAVVAPASTDKPKRGRPRTNLREIEKSSQEGCKEAETRATFIVNEQDLEKIKAVAYWERQSIKDVISAALRAYIEKYENKAGEVKPVPGRK